jgi:dCMP deaminase
MNKDLYFLGLARTTSQRATCSRLSVGAVVIQDDRVKGQGFNGAPRGVKHCSHPRTLKPDPEDRCRIAVHAEVNALLFSVLEPVHLTTMYVTHAPCFDCAKLILNTRVSRVVYGAYYRGFDGLHLLQDQGIEVVYGGDIG